MQPLILGATTTGNNVMKVRCFRAADWHAQLKRREKLSTTHLGAKETEI